MLQYEVRRIYFTILFTGSAIFMGLIAPTLVLAAVVDKQLDRTYSIQADGTVQVEERMRVQVTSSQYQLLSSSEEGFILFNPIVDDEQADKKLESTLNSLSVTDQNGNRLSFRREESAGNIVIYVRYPRTVRLGSPLTIVAKYTSHTLGAKTGMVYDLYVPSFSKDYQFSSNNSELKVNTTVNIPKTLGTLNFVTPNKQPTDAGDKLQVAFTQQELTGSVAWIQVGTKQLYSFEIKQPVSSSSTTGIYNNSYEMLLPRDIKSGPLKQSVTYTKLEPAPTSVREDSNGNLHATFKLPANFDGEIQLSGYISLEIDKSFDTTQSGELSDISRAILDANTPPAQYWETENINIQNEATKLKERKTNVYEILTTTYNYVVDRIDYSDVKRFGINERQGAAATLAGGAAVCMEYSDLFIALMRAQGVPARAAFGYGYDFRSTNGIDTPHQWAEVYLPAQDTWVLVDTTWGETGTPVVGADLNHIYKYVASQSPESPAPLQVRYVGNLATIGEEQFVIQPLASDPGISGISASELPDRFPQKTPDLFDNIRDGFTLIVGSADAGITNILTRLNIPADGQKIIKLVLLFAVIVVVITIVFAGIRNLILRPLKLVGRTSKKLVPRRKARSKVELVTDLPAA